MRMSLDPGIHCWVELIDPALHHHRHPMAWAVWTKTTSTPWYDAILYAEVINLIMIHWYSLIFIDIHWYSLVFIDKNPVKSIGIHEDPLISLDSKGFLRPTASGFQAANRTVKSFLQRWWPGLTCGELNMAMPSSKWTVRPCQIGLGRLVSTQHWWKKRYFQDLCENLPDECGTHNRTCHKFHKRPSIRPQMASNG